MAEAGRDRPGGRAKIGGGINDEIGNAVRGGVGRGAEQDRRRRRGGISGSKWVQWSGVERGRGRFSTQLDLRRARNNAGSKVEILNLKGIESSALIASVIG